MTLHSANTGQDEEDYGGFRNKGHHRLVHRWAKLNKSSYLLLKGEDSTVLQPHIDGGVDAVPLYPVAVAQGHNSSLGIAIYSAPVQPPS